MADDRPGSHLKLKKVASIKAGSMRANHTRYEAWDGGTLIGYIESFYPDIQDNRGGRMTGQSGRVKQWLYWLDGQKSDEGNDTFSRGEAKFQLWEDHAAREGQRGGMRALFPVVMTEEDFGRLALAAHARGTSEEGEEGEAWRRIALALTTAASKQSQQ
ncbi:hypothetical protein ACFY04_25890 [Streptomyces sp. NPDC001549]|uniref:hypothetical protein n=1 Tax=Streptomyces sp. NPDC001549 TaxID=3364586 RepID=UPI0036BFC781